MIYENIILISIAILLDFFIGDPEKFPHPIRFIGALISYLEKKVRNKNKNLKVSGFFIALITIIITFLSINCILNISRKVNIYFYLILKIYILFSALAARCLFNEGKKVYVSLLYEGIENSRKKLSYLVGRDTSELNEKEIIRATIETISENTIDGVISPLFFMILGSFFNMPAQFAYIYKAVNTLDSMIGYQNEKYREIGYFSAKIDDVFNYIPARMGGILMVISGAFFNLDIKNGFKIMIRDRKNHKSPNCAYPEGAIAGLLGIQLGGTNTYFGEKVFKPTIGNKLRDVKMQDIIETSKIIFISEILFFISFLLIIIYLMKIIR